MPITRDLGKARGRPAGAAQKAFEDFLNRKEYLAFDAHEGYVGRRSVFRGAPHKSRRRGSGGGGGGGGGGGKEGGGTGAKNGRLVGDMDYEPPHLDEAGRRKRRKGKSKGGVAAAAADVSPPGVAVGEEEEENLVKARLAAESEDWKKHHVK